MSGALTKLRLAIGERKWILWLIVAAAVVVAWFVIVALLPHHVVSALQSSEEQVNGLHEPPHGLRESP
jgi:hypothetical protein